MSRRKPNPWDSRDDRSYDQEFAEVRELFSVNSSEVSTSADNSFLLPTDEEFATVDERSFTEAPLSIQPSDPDEAVKLAFLAGSEEAFLQLYAKYEASLFYYCKRMLHSEWAAEDAFQEIWMHVFELRKRKNAKIGHFRGLFFRSARNLCLNMLRNGHSEESIEATPEDWPESEIREDRPRLEELKFEEPMTGAASGREIQSLMVKALRKLPFDQRETFVLHEY